MSISKKARGYMELLEGTSPSMDKFISNIRKQGWCSDKQFVILDTAMNKKYAPTKYDSNDITVNEIMKSHLEI